MGYFLYSCPLCRCSNSHFSFLPDVGQERDSTGHEDAGEYSRFSVYDAQRKFSSEPRKIAFLLLSKDRVSYK